MQRIDNPFWRDVFKHYKKLSLKCCPQNVNEFVDEYIHYNVNFARDKRIIYIQEWYDSNILQIKDLMDEEGNFLSFEGFQRKYPQLNTNFLTFMGIVHTIKKSSAEIWF